MPSDQRALDFIVKLVPGFEDVPDLFVYGHEIVDLVEMGP